MVYAIGDEKFRVMARDELRSKEIEMALTGDIIWPEDEMASIEMVEYAVKESFRVSGEDLRCHGRRAGSAKAVAVELCCRLTGRSQREVARYFCYKSESAAGKQRRLVQVQLAEDKKLAGTIANIEFVVRQGISKKHTNE